MHSLNLSLNIGDLLTRPKLLGLLDHAGVVVAPDTVLHNTPDKGEHLATVREFSAGHPVTVVRTGTDPLTIRERCRRILSRPKRYDAISRNCQHTAFETLTGLARSPYVHAVLFVLFVVAVYYFWLRRR